MASQMKKWFWIALIPSLLFASSHPYNMRKDPIYIDVHSNRFILVEEEKTIKESELAVKHNIFDKFMEQVARLRKQRYLLLLLRPGSEQLRQQLQQITQKYDVDIGVDVWEEGRAFSKEEMMGIYDMGTAEPPKPDPLAHLVPYSVTLREDHLTLDKDNITVRYDELQTPGNPFEAFVDQCEANGGNPYIFPSSPLPLDARIPLLQKVRHIIKVRSPSMDSNYQAMNEQIAPPTPIEAQTDGMEPVYFECRNNRLFSIPANEHQKTNAKVEGYYIDSPTEETDEMWFGSQLAELDTQSQYISFVVRPDSYDIFRRARKVLWDRKIPSTLQLMNKNAPLAIGTDGQLLFPERN